MRVLYSLFFSLTGAFLSQITPDYPLHEFQADRTLLSTSAPHRPVASIVEPKYLNVLVHGIGTPAKQTSSLDPAGLKYSVFFLLSHTPFPSSTSLQKINIFYIILIYLNLTFMNWSRTCFI